jgi:hypothetical protein
MKPAARILLSLAMLAAAASRAADDPTASWRAVDDDRLDQARGGFETGEGLLLALGVERLVSINGEMVAGSKVNISDATKLGPAQAEALAAVTLVQNGAGNVFTPGVVLPAGALVIQNSASDQLIRSQTTINATVNSLSLLKGLNFEASLRSALGSAVGSH